MQNILINSEYMTACGLLATTAKKDIKILMYDWRHYEKDPSSSVCAFNHALSRAIKRGVKVSCIVDRGNGLYFAKEHGAEVKKWAGGKSMHAKILLVDNEKYICGSHNMTENANGLNQEISIIGDDVHICERLNQQFKNLWLYLK